MIPTSSAIGGPLAAVARPSSFRPRPRQPPPPFPPVLPAPPLFHVRLGERERKRLSFSSVSARGGSREGTGEEASAVAAAAAPRREEKRRVKGERADPAAFPIHRLHPRVLDLIRARTGGGEKSGLSPPPPPAASAVFTIVNEAAFSAVRVRLADAEALFGSLFPASALGLRGRALAAALRASGSRSGGEGNGRGVLWSTAVGAMVDAETCETYCFGSNVDKVGDDERGKGGGNGLRLVAYGNGYPYFHITTGWSELLHRLGARSVGCRVRIERYGGGGGGGDGGGGAEGGGGGADDEKKDRRPPLFLVTAETGAGEPTARNSPSRTLDEAKAVVYRRNTEWLRKAPRPQPQPLLSERSEGLRAAVVEKLGGREPEAAAAASFDKTIVSADQVRKVSVRHSDVAKLFGPVLPPGAIDLRGRLKEGVELKDALRADEERRRASGTSTSKGLTVWSTEIDLVVESSGGGAKKKSGDEKEEEEAPEGSGGGAEKKKSGDKKAPSASPPAPTIVRVKLIAAITDNSLKFRISEGWSTALRVAGASEPGSQVVLERFDASKAAAASSSSCSGGDRGLSVFVATAAGKVPPPPSSEEIAAADLAHRAEADAHSNEARRQLTRELVEAHGRRVGRAPTLAASVTKPLERAQHFNEAVLRQADAKEVLGRFFPKGARKARGQALLNAFLDATRKGDGGDGKKKEGEGEEEEEQDEELRGFIWETPVEIAVSLTGATIPVSLVAVLHPLKHSHLGKKRPHRTSEGSGEGRGESEEVKKANNRPKGKVGLRLVKNWCDVVRAALARRRIGDSIVLETYNFGPGEEPLLVATGLRGEEEEEEEEKK